MGDEIVIGTNNDFCLCDHEEQNNLPRTQTCIFVCPKKAREMMAPFQKALSEAIKKKKDEIQNKG